jgi:hypothetical protein
VKGRTGVLFDLFGTIVPPFRMREHKDAIRQCADCMGIDAEHYRSYRR